MKKRDLQIARMIVNKYGERALVTALKPKVEIYTEGTGTVLNPSDAQIRNDTWRCEILKKAAEEKQKAEKAAKKAQNAAALKAKKKLFRTHFFEIILEKLEGYALVLDQSTNHSAIAVYDLSHYDNDKWAEDIPPVEYENFLPDKIDFVRGSTFICERVQYYIDKYKPEYLGVEGTYLNTRFGKGGGVDTFEKLSFLKNRLVELAYENKLQVTVVPSKLWKDEYNITGKDYNEKKQNALLKVKALLGDEVTLYFTDDNADCHFIQSFIMANRVTILMKTG